MRCYRKLLDISNLDRITNEEMRKQIWDATCVLDYLLAMVKKRIVRSHLTFFWHGKDKSARHDWRDKKWKTEEKKGRHHQGMDRSKFHKLTKLPKPNQNGE